MYASKIAFIVGSGNRTARPSATSWTMKKSSKQLSLLTGITMVRWCYKVANAMIRLLSYASNGSSGRSNTWVTSVWGSLSRWENKPKTPTGDGSMQELTAICSGSKLRTNHSTEKFILPASSMIFTPGWNVSAAFSVAVTKPVQEWWSDFLFKRPEIWPTICFFWNRWISTWWVWDLIWNTGILPYGDTGKPFLPNRNV